MTRWVDPTDPWEWVRRARSNLARAATHPGDPHVLYEDLCFDAQQAAEKAIKAVLVRRQVDFPKTHSIAELLTLAAGRGIAVPGHLDEVAYLTSVRRDHSVPTAWPRGHRAAT